MKGFLITTPDKTEIRFSFDANAPITSKAFAALLPFSASFVHARVSGEEIWIDNAPPIDVIQENASVFTEPGEVVYGPIKPARTKTANCMGIYYGQGKGLDCANIFAKVFAEDKHLMEALGKDIWEHGRQDLLISPLY